jgi:hypothetical protein
MLLNNKIKFHTFRELRDALNKLTDNQLDCEVNYYCTGYKGLQTLNELKIAIDDSDDDRGYFLGMKQGEPYMI